MYYIDLLDSVKSAHSKKEFNEWWRPKEERHRAISISMSHAVMMIPLLYGETISLSNNQSMDSVSWFEAIQYINTLPKIEWPPVAVSFFGMKKEPAPDTFLELVIKNIEDKKFVLSAWVGLDDKIRDNIAKNLRTGRSLYKMLEGVGLDPEIDELLTPHAIALGRFYDYLVNWPNPKEVCTEAQKTGLSLWNNIQSVRDQENGIPGNILDEIKSFIIREDESGDPWDLERRGKIYDALGEIQIDEISRDHVRSFVDRYYNHQVGKSVTQGIGRGAFSMRDISRPSSILNQANLDNLADNVNTPDLNPNFFGLKIISEKTPEIEGITWENISELLGETEVRNGALIIQHLFRMLAHAPKSETEAYYKKIQDEVLKQQELIATELAPLVALETGIDRFAKKTVNWLRVIIATQGYALIQILSNIGIESLLINIVPALVTGAGVLATDNLSEIIKREEIGVVAGRIREQLGEAIKIKTGE